MKHGTSPLVAAAVSKALHDIAAGTTVAAAAKRHKVSEASIYREQRLRRKLSDAAKQSGEV